MSGYEAVGPSVRTPAAYRGYAGGSSFWFGTGNLWNKLMSDRTIREFEVGKNGIRIGTPLTEFQGVLTGNPEFSGKSGTLIRERDERTKKTKVSAGHVLLCAPFGKDTEILAEMVSSEGLSVTHSASLNELAQQFSEETDVILLTEEALVSSSLQTVQRALRRQEPWSGIPIILLASAGVQPSPWDNRVRV